MEIRAFAEQVLTGTTLADKLLDPGALTDRQPGSPVGSVAVPARPEGLALDPGGRREKRASPSRLDDPRQRAEVLHALANHELLAAELMALALLRFVDAPPAFRRGLAATLLEEQRHLRLYLERMAAHGVALGEHRLSGFFWRVLHDVRDPLEFVACMALTLEQANLDYAHHHATLFEQAGDLKSAEVLRTVLADEIGHVGFGLRWFERWRTPGPLLQAHARALRPPMTLARARGIGFVREPRIAAGLPEDYVEALSCVSASKGRAPVVHWYNPTAELEVAGGRGYRAPASVMAAVEDLETLPMLTAAADDIVLVRRQPDPEYLAGLARLGFAIPQFVEAELDGRLQVPAGLPEQLGGLRPWGCSPRTHAWAEPLRERLGPGATDGAAFDASHAEAYRKSTALEVLTQILTDPEPGWMTLRDLGEVASSIAEVEAALDRARAAGHAQVAIKGELGTSGRNTIRVRDGLEDNQRRFVRRLLAEQGAVVVEPWLDRIADLSFRITAFADRPPRIDGIGRFVTDARGQYCGAVLGRIDAGLDPACIRFLNGDGRDPDRLGRLASTVAEAVTRRLPHLRGPVGLDAMLYRDRAGQLRLRPLLEINPRMNMGHVALALQRHLAPGTIGWWTLLSTRHVQDAGGFRAWWQAKCEQAPPRTREQGGRALLTDGLVAFNDPGRARSTLAVLSVAPDLPRARARLR